jgi:hypothetical protein
VVSFTVQSLFFLRMDLPVPKGKGSLVGQGTGLDVEVKTIPAL